MRRWRSSAHFPAEFCVDPPPPRPRRYTRLYTKDQLQLVPQERPWGFTEQAELINGRIAMVAITAASALSISQGNFWDRVLDGALPFQFW